MGEGRMLSEAGVLLKRYLVERGRSQVWLTRELGMAQETLSKKLRGKLLMDREAIYAISRVLGLSDDELRALMVAAGEEKPPSPSAAAVVPPPPLQPGTPRTDDEATQTAGSASAVRPSARRREGARAASPTAPHPDPLGQQLEQLVSAAHLSREERALFEKRLLAVAAELLAVIKDVQHLHETAGTRNHAMPT